MLDAAMIAPGRVLRHACSADRLLTAYLVHPRLRGQLYRASHGREFVRGVISSGLPTRGGRARIVVTRGGGRGRRLVNEGRHPRFPGCARLRCVTMDGLSVPEQAALFERAEIVVAPHCAAVTNLIPAREGAVVVGLFPPRHIEPSHFATASHRKLRYDYVVGEEARGTPRDFAVDVDKLAHLMATYGLA